MGQPGRPAKAREKIIAGVDDYLALHTEDPERYPREKEAYGRWLGVAHGTIHQRHPAVEEALKRLIGAPERTAESEPAAEDRRPTIDDLRAQIEASLPRGLSDDELVRRIDRALEEVRWAVSAFHGQWLTDRQRGKMLPRLPLVVEDLDRMLGALHKHQESLRPLATEHHRRVQRAALDVAQRMEE